jgi:hypothetical protein
MDWLPVAFWGIIATAIIISLLAFWDMMRDWP